MTQKLNNKIGSYTEIEGNLITLAKQGKFQGIAHGANCKNIMGGGIAKQIKDEFLPALYADSDYLLDDYHRLGNYSSCLIPLDDKGLKHLEVFNLYTQVGLGACFNLSALDIALHKLSRDLPMKYNLGLPQIGCGIGGGNWEEVKQVIESHTFKINITVVIYDGK